MNNDLDGVTSLVDSGVLFLLPSCFHSFVSNVGLFSVLQGSQLDYVQVYRAYHCSLDVDWDDEAFLEYLPYRPSSDEASNTRAREVTSVRRSVHDVQRKRFVRSVPVKIKPGSRKAIEEALTAVNASHFSSSGFFGFISRCPCCRT